MNGEEKYLYIPKTQPEVIEAPKLNYITIHGEGSPAEEAFTSRIGALYSLAYAIKMLPKKMDEKPSGYFDFTVYPLEGVWDINNKAKESYSGEIKKEDFVYKLMIRQPDFVKLPLFKEILNYVKKNPLLNQVNFETISEEKCVQMLHLGRFEDEPISFEKMEAFTKDQGLNRLSKVHKEISLSDTRKVVPEKLKTVLRFRVG
ncbi:GyrI-like domain-containing protein [Microbulbifer sp. VAAF005]|uniref:GyrI-like domain-containing protein n=1 Tax=Microbulbifer sp. VAAF005 TaxID=3034230 RepID=UPI0024AE82DF|nr:GyrI-like domain-containing protein [Microbulbifer sp. VAAF005]WHI47716.1 GyrI-like domain-containing protein [Microbulbifer sp. VAAF005]